MSRQHKAQETNIKETTSTVKGHMKVIKHLYGALQHDGDPARRPNWKPILCLAQKLGNSPAVVTPIIHSCNRAWLLLPLFARRYLMHTRGLHLSSPISVMSLNLNLRIPRFIRPPPPPGDPAYSYSAHRRLRSTRGCRDVTNWRRNGLLTFICQRMCGSVCVSRRRYIYSKYKDSTQC